MLAFAGREADDANFSLQFDTFLDENRYEFHEVDSNEVQSTGLFQEMINMLPPVVQNPPESAQQADNNGDQNATTGKTSRHKILTSSDVDNVQNESIRPRTRKQTNWGVNVFKGIYFFTEN